MTSVSLCSTTENLAGLKALFKVKAPDLEVTLWGEGDASEADVAVCWFPEHGALAKMPKLKFASSLAAGVDSLLADPALPQVPVCRIVDPNLAHGMAEYVVWATLHFHRGLDRALQNQASAAWKAPHQRAAFKTKVGVLGMGVLGTHVAGVLAGMGFTVSGWSRSAKDISNVATFAGDDALPGFLAAQDVVVCLLPLTPATHHLFNSRTFAHMKAGSALINVGRGEHVVLDDLLASLDAGHLRGAVLDVFETEPLPADNRCWSDPRIVVTPHMASTARFDVIVDQIVANVRRMQAGEPLVHTIDRARGY
jgi:glyoxylate/hydroxypyruvate reductase A